MNSQADDILAHLQSGKSLTPLEALADFGCFRLGARIWDLRTDGHDIKTEMVKLGNGKHVAKYSMGRGWEP